MEATIQLIQVTPEQLQEIFSTTLKEQIETLKAEFQPKEPEEYLTRKEAAKLLKINLSTLHAWVNKEKLNPLGIGGKVYFKRSEIEECLTPLK